MRDYDEYDASDAAIEALAADAPLGRLVSVSPEGVPHLGLYPFLRDGQGIARELRARGRRDDDRAADALLATLVD